MSRPKYRNPSEPSLRLIATLVAQECGLPVATILGRCRTQRTTAARQLAHYIARHATTRSTTDIAHYLGGVNHTTALHGIRRTARRLEQDQGEAQDEAGGLGAQHRRIVARIAARRPAPPLTLAPQPLPPTPPAPPPSELPDDPLAPILLRGPRRANAAGSRMTREDLARQNERFVAALRAAHPEMARGPSAPGAAAGKAA